MESNPPLGYGMPGPLVDFLGPFFGKGYKHRLVESVRSYPTPHTLWMLNRLINGTRSLEQRHPQGRETAEEDRPMARRSRIARFRPLVRSYRGESRRSRPCTGP